MTAKVREVDENCPRKRYIVRRAARKEPWGIMALKECIE